MTYKTEPHEAVPRLVMSENPFVVGDTVVSRTDRRGLRWKVTCATGDLITAERRRKGHVPIVAIYRHTTWRKVS